MSAHSRGAGPGRPGTRHNLPGRSRLADSGLYNPFYAEGMAAYYRFAGRLEEAPAFPRIITLRPLPGFMHACRPDQVERRLAKMPASHVEGLRAVFLLGGRRKQQRSWYSDLACYGFYWNACVFLCAHPLDLGDHNLDSIRDFYLDNVLVHEVGHHVDRDRDAPDGKKENFANGFVEQRRA